MFVIYSGRRLRSTVMRGASLALLSVTMAAGLPPSAFAQAKSGNAATKINIPAGPLNETLRRIGDATGSRISFDPDAVSHLRSRPVRGKTTARDAVVAAISGTHLAVTVHSDGSIQVIAADAAEPGDILVTAQRDEAETRYNVNKATSSTRTGQTLRDIPQSTSVISDKLIRDQQAQTVLDALRNAGGVAATLGTGQGPANFLVRGYSANALTNGLSTPGATSNPVAGIERVEVIRGPVAILAGSDSFGGTVNIVPKKPTASPLLNVALEYQTFGDKKATIDASNAITADRSLSARIIGEYEDADRAAGGYDGRKERLFSPSLRYKTASIDVTAGISAAETFSPRTRATIYDDVAKRPRTDIASPLGPTGQGGHIDSTRYYVDSSFTPASWLTLVARGEHYKVDLDFRYQYFFGTPDATGNVTVTDSRTAQTIGGNAADTYARAKFSTGPFRHTLIAGVNYADSHTVSRSADDRVFAINVFRPGVAQAASPVKSMPDNIVDAHTTGAYVQDLVEAGPVHLIGSVRRTWYKSALVNPAFPDSNNSEDRASTVPSAGLVLDVTKDVSLYGNFLKGFAPTSGLDCQGNRLPDLHSRNVEAGMKADLFNRSLSVVASAFDIRTDVRFQSAPPPCRFDRQVAIPGGQVNRGVELTVTGSPVRGLNLNASYSLQDVRYRNPLLLADFPEYSQVIVPGVSRHSYSFFGAYERPMSRRILLGGGVGVYGNSRSFADNGGTKPVPGGAQIDGNLYLTRDRTRLNIGVRNIFDKLLYSPVTTPFNIPIREGRRLIVTLSHAFY